MRAVSEGDQSQEWSIQEIARLTGTTSRTLRHYDQIGLLPPSRVGFNGYRHYNAQSLLRLQRILLLRQMGLGLPEIARALEGDSSDQAAQTQVLREHLQALCSEQQRLGRQIASVQHTITTLEGGGELMADTMFDGFNHTQHKDEVIQRWGADAWKRSNTWWEGLSAEEKQRFTDDVESLNAAWRSAADDGVAPDSDRAQDLASRHVAWLDRVPSAPRTDGRLDPAYLLGLAEMYVADERFAANYGGAEGAQLVRDALTEWVRRSRS
ncbi:MerR family transcriptional regulator [Nesterenkonia flava]|uniref:MerR family transcriptional regulator n=1 Tax=Nesterenkonia flava TaxID=469799 RepID=A0ABU1FSP8_9MICC|nr:MerR family transcriptional regulator [Nesterenkonia flava]MDR5711161.1 MerR family transcriptional regulator [Nesterenkonia flava]